MAFATPRCWDRLVCEETCCGQQEPLAWANDTVQCPQRAGQQHQDPVSSHPPLMGAIPVQSRRGTSSPASFAQVPHPHPLKNSACGIKRCELTRNRAKGLFVRHCGGIPPPPHPLGHCPVPSCSMHSSPVSLVYPLPVRSRTRIPTSSTAMAAAAASPRRSITALHGTGGRTGTTAGSS